MGPRRSSRSIDQDPLVDACACVRRSSMAGAHASRACDMCLSRRVLDAATGSFHVRSRRVLVHMATSAYRRAALKELHAMKGSRAHEHAAVGARLQRLCMLCHVAAYADMRIKCVSCVGYCML